MLKRKILVLLPIKKNQACETLSYKEIENHFDPLYTEVTVASLPDGPEAIETKYGVDMATSSILKEIQKVSMLYDGIIINCILDPALESSRHASKSLVIAPLQSSLAAARLIGENIGILSLVKGILPLLNRLVKEYGHSASVHYVDALSTPDYKAKMIEEAQSMVDSGIDVIILGITGFIGIAKEIESKVKVPVIDPSVTAFKLLNSLLDMKLTHSKIRNHDFA